MTYPLPSDKIYNAAVLIQKNCHGLARHCGWWQDLRTGQDLIGDYRYSIDPDAPQPPRNIPEMLMLTTSELVEGMEGARKGLMDDHLPHRTMLEVELADAVIRIFDMAGGLDLDLPGALIEKLHYNAKRQDHTPEHRAAEGGKQF